MKQVASSLTFSSLDCTAAAEPWSQTCKQYVNSFQQGPNFLHEIVTRREISFYIQE